ncbi:MAG: UPF0175 family protein [Acidobacteriota bacterium]
MQTTRPVEIPVEWLEGVPDETAALQQIFRMGLRQYRIERAIALYRDGVGSLGYIAEILHLDKRDLVREARLRGIDPEFSEESVREELAE